MTRNLGVVLLSGGLDSTTVATQAVRDGYDLIAVTVHYGQLHSRELDAAATVAATLGLHQEVVDVSFFGRLAWYSALTNPERFAIPAERTPEEMATDIPITYVPMRNTFLLSLASAYLESHVLHVLEAKSASPESMRAALFIAANAIDYSGYPDCRPEFYRSLAETLRLGSKIGTQYGVPFKIETPLLQMTKAEIVRHAVRIGAPLDLTWSCYKGGPAPCGGCDSCLLRAKGFEEAGILDPAPTLT
ncbi:MAG: 7-cyano-7-deazaguanine synthase QueC [Chloroflexi bacterium]|nr:7-cyano-7-deazaguanine synthase QueC [Chloroflexota bacterium]